MKDFSSKLKRALKEKKVSQKTLAANIGMSETGFVQMINNSSIKVETLERICEELGLPINYFFEDAQEVKVQDSETVWKRLINEVTDEATSWRLKAYRYEDILKQNGITFHSVSKRGGVLAA